MVNTYLKHLIKTFKYVDVHVNMYILHFYIRIKGNITNSNSILI